MLAFKRNTLRPRQIGRHFCDDIFKYIFLNQMYKLRLIFHWNLFPRVQLTIFQDWFREWLGQADQVASHYLKQWWYVYWRIYAILGVNELCLYVHILPPLHCDEQAGIWRLTAQPQTQTLCDKHLIYHLTLLRVLMNIRLHCLRDNCRWQDFFPMVLSWQKDSQGSAVSCCQGQLRIGSARQIHRDHFWGPCFSTQDSD